MKFIRRWTTTIGTSFDWVISQVENHEALCNSALKDMQQAGAKAKVQLKRVEQDGKRMRNRLAELNDSAQTWADRAIRVHEADKERALECIRRKKQVEREIAYLKTQISEHSSLEKQLASDLRSIDTRIAELKRKRNALSARQHRAEALHSKNIDDIGLISEIDEIFERWDLKLAECESYTSVSDTFEDTFEDEEEKHDLEDSLQELLSTTNN